MYFGVPWTESSVMGPVAVKLLVVERSCSGIPDFETVTTFTVRP